VRTAVIAHLTLRSWQIEAPSRRRAADATADRNGLTTPPGTRDGAMLCTQFAACDR